MLLSFLGIWMPKASPALAIKMLALAASGTISDYVFGVVPLFVLMGLLVSIDDVGRETFEVAHRTCGHGRDAEAAPDPADQPRSPFHR